MNNNTLISVVLCTWNSEKTISETVLSLYNQSYKDFELVVVDKESTDGTIEIIKDKFSQANIVNQEGKGIYNAFNVGVKSANGELIFILNSDDIITPNALQSIIDNYGTKGFDAAFLPVYSGGGYKSKNLYGKLYKGCDYCFIGHSASFVVRKNVHLEIGYYDETIKNCADHDFFLRLIDNNYKIEIINTLSFGVFRPGGFSGSGNYLEKRIEEYKFRLKRKKIGISDILYCYFIFPLQLIWGVLKKIKS